MKTMLLTGVLALAALQHPIAAGPNDALATSSPKPNILLIIADDLNDWITPMGGHPQARTPHLDRLAARGVTFLNAHCPAPICNPSRTAMFSGQRPTTTGVYHNQQPWMKHIPPKHCLNDYLRQFGFTSLAAGKIYHYRNYKPEEWDEVFYPRDDTLPNSVANRTPGPFGYRMFTSGKPEAPFQEQRAEELLVDAQSVTWCVEQLNRQTNPFFMACGLHRPHTPWDVPKKYFDLHPLESIQLPAVLTNDLADVPPPGLRFAGRTVHANIIQAGLWKDRVRAYLAAVSFADAQVGRLLDALEASPHRDNTIIVFVGDNGWHLGEKEHWAKSALWREATCVPLIWVAPGLTKGGTRCEQAVDLMSVFPTLCELAGVPVPKHAEGVSIRPLLADPKAAWPQPALVTHLPGNHAICTADWRYIRYADGSEELYDERKDPNEWTNLAAKPELADVKKKLARYLPAKEAAPVESVEPPQKKKKKKKGNALAQNQPAA
ncbi:MAG TPA: sulfatase [Verrucomicrobiota bacterium]|nr:sulfatase [Verrucomicrobiota bacterium]HRT08523.1 sulfatase [Candidatus Paceibacterota bacterium]HRT58423.1 sulfatase [Candidatus Paceibacterota bacterium]